MPIRWGDRGFALFVTLLMSVVVVMLLSATIFSARGGSVFTQDYHAKTAAFCAAESGLAILQQRLETPDYASPADELTPFGTGRYRYNFGTGGCINNLGGDLPVPGPYGDVPAHSAYIKIEGEANGHIETIECVLGRKETDFITSAVVASGKITFDGDISIAGERSHDHLTQLPADVISNYDKDWAPGNPPLFYVQGSHSAKIEGVVRSASSSNSAISTDLRNAADDALTDQAPVPLANIDVAAEVASKSSYDAPSPMGGTLSGNLYQSTNYSVPGDLVLDDANLYVKGNLTVVGSISGRGSIYVSGDTTFSGDSMVASTDSGVALYSQGNVSLTGFDGSQFMDILTHAKGGEWPAVWDQAKLDLGLIAGYLESGNDAHLRVASTNPNDFWGTDVGKMINILSNTAGLDASPHPTLPKAQVQTNVLYRLGLLLDGQTSTAGQFMLKKIKALRSGPVNKGSDPVNPVNLTGALGINYGSTNQGLVDRMDDFLETGVVGDCIFNHFIWVKAARISGNTTLYNEVTTPEVDLAIRKMTNWIRNYDYDKLGSSYFKGAIYTRGALYADHEVTIVGSVAVVADPRTADQAADFKPTDGVKLRPGDLYLGNGTNITYVADLIPGVENGSPRVGVSYWLK